MGDIVDSIMPVFIKNIYICTTSDKSFGNSYIFIIIKCFHKSCFTYVIYCVYSGSTLKQ